MKKAFIHRGIYIESLRRLRLSGILLTVIPFLLVLPVMLTKILNSYDYVSYYPTDFAEVYPIIYILPFVAPLVLTGILFSAQNKRCHSDFYHSLPLTKRCLSVSWLAAVLCWLIVIIVGSALPIRLLLALRFDTVEGTFLLVGGALLASFMLTAVLFLSYNLSGNTVTALFFTATLLFAPGAISYLLSLPLTSNCSVTASETADLFQYQLLYGNYDKPLAWIVTASITVCCLTLGYAVAGNRRSELAGQAAVSRTLQAVLRLTVAYVFCLPALYYAFFDTDILTAAVLFTVALVVYFLFELFTTKKAKNMLKAIPWLGVLAILCIVSVVGMNLSFSAYCRFSPEPEDVRSVSITDLERYHASNDAYYRWSMGEPDAKIDEDSTDAALTDSEFWVYEEEYDTSDGPSVKLTELTHRQIACDALARNLRYSQTHEYIVLEAMTNSGHGYVFYRVTLAYQGTLHTRYRSVWLYSDEFVELFGSVAEQAGLRLPPTFGTPETVCMERAPLNP